MPLRFMRLHGRRRDCRVFCALRMCDCNGWRAPVLCKAHPACTNIWQRSAACGSPCPDSVRDGRVAFPGILYIITARRFPMDELTPRQAEVLRLIADFLQSTGFPPTRADI